MKVDNISKYLLYNLLNEPNQEYVEIPVHFLYLFKHEEAFILSYIIKINQNIANIDIITIINSINKQTKISTETISKALNKFIQKKIISLTQISDSLAIKIDFEYLNALMERVNHKVIKRAEIISDPNFGMEI